MDPRLQEMLDHHEIARTLADYCRGSDRGDFRRLIDVYAEDSWDDHGLRKGPGPDYARDSLAQLESSNMCCHVLGQTVTDIRGDEAGAETNFIANIRTNDAEGVELLNQFGGRYVDRLVREGGRWRIKFRQVVKEWSVTWPIEKDWLAGIEYVRAHRSGQDPSYCVLNQFHSSEIATRET